MFVTNFLIFISCLFHVFLSQNKLRGKQKAGTQNLKSEKGTNPQKSMEGANHYLPLLCSQEENTCIWFLVSDNPLCQHPDDFPSIEKEKYVYFEDLVCYIERHVCNKRKVEEWYRGLVLKEKVWGLFLREGRGGEDEKMGGVVTVGWSHTAHTNASLPIFAVTKQTHLLGAKTRQQCEGRPPAGMPCA